MTTHIKTQNLIYFSGDAAIAAGSVNSSGFLYVKAR